MVTIYLQGNPWKMLAFLLILAKNAIEYHFQAFQRLATTTNQTPCITADYLQTGFLTLVFNCLYFRIDIHE